MYREAGVHRRMDRHMARRHKITGSHWLDDSVGGYCRICWMRVEPGELLPHWRTLHGLDEFASFDECIDPYTQEPNRQLVSMGDGPELTRSLQAYGQMYWNLSTDDFFSFAF